MKSKKIISIIILIVTIIGLSTISNAALESKAGQTGWTTYANTQFINIRAMEKSGGTLGQNAKINGTTYLDSSKNGIDVHMALATEWGTVAILSISDYGAYKTTEKANVAATTGNITGVFQMADNSPEYVVGILEKSSNQYTSTIYSADSRYKNEYTTTTSKYHKGDAVYQTTGWYSGNYAYVSSNAPIFYRGGMFSLFASNGNHYNKARACIVCGEDL